jgi:negative regulator of sigma E activity
VKLLSIIHASKPGAAARTVATANDAVKLGFTNVETHYLPQTREHTVTGDLPATTAQRTIDRILGR